MKTREKLQPAYHVQKFKNKLTNEVVENYFSNETHEVDGNVFWKTVNKRGTVALLAKDSWIIQSKKQ